MTACGWAVDRGPAGPGSANAAGSAGREPATRGAVAGEAEDAAFGWAGRADRAALASPLALSVSCLALEASRPTRPATCSGSSWPLEGAPAAMMPERVPAATRNAPSSAIMPSGEVWTAGATSYWTLACGRRARKS